MDKSADLRDWFKARWVDLGRKNPDGSHPECGRDDADKGSYPKCRPARAAARMSKKQKTYAVRAKRSKPQGVGGKPTMVATFKKKAMFNPEIDSILERLDKAAKAKQLELFPDAAKPSGSGSDSSAKKSMAARAGKMITDHPGKSALTAGAGLAALYAAKKYRDKKRREAAEQAGMYKAAFKNPEVYDILEELDKEAFFRAIRAATKGTLAGAGGRKGYRRVVSAQRFANQRNANIASAAQASRAARRAGARAALPASPTGTTPIRTKRRTQMEARASRTARNRPNAEAARMVSGGRSAARPSAPKPSTGQGTQGTFSFASPAAPSSTPSTPSAPKTGLQKGLGVAKSLGRDAMNYAQANPLKTAGGVALAAGAANAMRRPKTNPQTGQPETTRAGQALRGAAVGGALAYGGSKLLKKVATSNPLSNPMNSNLRKMASAETAYILDSLEKEAGAGAKRQIMYDAATGSLGAGIPALIGQYSAARTPTQSLKESIRNSTGATGDAGIIPGVGGYKHAKRVGAMIRGPEAQKLEKEERDKLKRKRAQEHLDKTEKAKELLKKRAARYRQGTHELLATNLNPLQLASAPLGGAAALVTKTKSLREIAAKDAKKDETKGSRTKAHLARNLIPGKAGYDHFKRLGAANHGPEAKKMKKEVDEERAKKKG